MAKIYEFPMLDDGYVAIEQKFLELKKRHRDGEKLEPEVKDWLDWANNVLWVN